MLAPESMLASGLPLTGPAVTLKRSAQALSALIKDAVGQEAGTSYV